MICDLCHQREATFFVEQTSKSGKRKLHFCAECVKQRGFSTDPRELSKALNSLFQEFFKQGESKDLVCPVCGQHLSQILLTGLVGCPECYEIFKDNIIQYLEKHNAWGTYSGSMPKRLASFRCPLTDRIEVQKKLEQAIQDEDYEKAAFYRDYLHAIETKAIEECEE